MKKYLLPVILLTTLCCRYCRGQNTPTDNTTPVVMKRVDSFLHTERKYKKTVKKINAIPDTQRVTRIVYWDSFDSKGTYITDSKGNDIPKDICCYQVGYATADAEKPRIIYYVYYSVKASRILHASKKVRWHRPY